MKKSLTSMLAALVVCAALTAASASVATGAVTTQARAQSAYGCNAWNPFSIGKYPLATGGYCVRLEGSGTFVKYVGGGFKSAGTVCNWNITAEFFDVRGNWYQTLTGPVHYGCNLSAEDVIWVNAGKKPGRMCSTLKSNGTRVTSVCHSIY